jgi:ATP-binding cassette subfamily B protein
MIAANFAQQWLPLVLKKAVDGLKGGAGLELVVGWALLRVALVFAQSWLRYGWRLGLLGASRKVEHGVRGRLFGHIASQGRDFTQRWPLGELVTRALGDLSALREFLGRGGAFFLDAATLAAFTLLAMARLDLRTALFCAAPLALVPVLVVGLGRRINDLSRGSQESLDRLSLLASESFSGARTVKAYAREETEAARFSVASAEVRDRELKVAVWSAFYEPTIAAVFGLSLAAVFWSGGERVAEGSLSLGAFAALIDYALQLAGPLRQFGMCATLYQKGKASVERLNEVLDERTGVRMGPGRAPNPTRRGLHWDHVDFSYAAGPKAVEGLDLEAEQGTWLGLCGGVGSGKTTLLRLALRLHDPDRGTIWGGGRDLRTLDPKDWRSQVAWAGQDCAILSLTVAENLRLGAPKASETELWAALECAGFREEVEALPEGLGTILGERGVNLSGGQRQRLGLARALLKPADIWLLDDTLSAVDTVVEERMLSGLRRRLKGCTVVLAAHRASTLAHCDRVATLRGGRLVSVAVPGARNAFRAEEGPSRPMRMVKAPLAFPEGVHG